MTSSATRCPTCLAIRPPGADFCPQCGTPYEMGRRAAPDVSPPPGPIDTSWRTAIKLGAGFAIGAGLVGVVLSCVAIIWLALSLGFASR